MSFAGLGLESASVSGLSPSPSVEAVVEAVGAAALGVTGVVCFFWRDAAGSDFGAVAGVELRLEVGGFVSRDSCAGAERWVAVCAA